MSGVTKSAASHWISRVYSLIEPGLVVGTVSALAIGGIAWLGGWRGVAQGCWVAGTLLAVVPAVAWVLLALRRGRVGVDIIAVLSLVGTLLVGEYLAGALIAVMLAGGRALDSAAERRASRDLRALARACAAIRAPTGRSAGQCDPAGGGGNQRCAGRRPRRGRAGGRAGRGCGRGPRRVRADRRAAAGRTRGRRTDPQRCGQCRQRLRAARHRNRRREHLRRHRATGAAGRCGKRADRAVGRPLCGMVSAAGASAGRGGLAG